MESKEPRLVINETQVDVTQEPVIGVVVTKPIGTLPSVMFKVIQVVDTEIGKIYVTNQWYKEHHKIPQLVPEAMVQSYTPVAEGHLEDDEDRGNELIQNKPAPVTFGLGGIV